MQLVVDQPTVAHNTYIGVLAELGVVGLIAFAVVVLAAFALARRAVKAFARARDPELELLSRAVLISLVGMLTAFFFLSGLHENQLWLLLGLAVALNAIAVRRQRDDAPLPASQADASP